MAEKGIFGVFRKKPKLAVEGANNEKEPASEKVGEVFTQKKIAEKPQTEPSKDKGFTPEGDKTDEIVAALEKLRADKEKRIAEEKQVQETAPTKLGKNSDSKPVEVPKESENSFPLPLKADVKKEKEAQKQAEKKQEAESLIAAEAEKSIASESEKKPEKTGAEKAKKNDKKAGEKIPVKKSDFFNQTADVSSEEKDYDLIPAETEASVAKELFDEGDDPDKPVYKKTESETVDIVVVLLILVAILVVAGIWLYFNGGLDSWLT